MIRDRPVDFYSGSNVYTVVFGLVGLVLGVLILLGLPGKGNSRFHEIAFSPGVNTGSFLEDVKKVDSDRLAQAQQMIDQCRKDKVKDTGVLSALIDTLHIRLTRVTEQQFQWEYGNKDTVFDSNIHYSIKRDSLYLSVSGFIAVDTLTIGYFDRGLSDKILSYRVPLNIHHYVLGTDFFLKYPSFALWIFLGITQMVVWFLTIPICVFIYRLVGKKGDLLPFYKKSSWYKSALLAFCTVVVFCFLVYKIVIDKLVIEDVYFMDGFVGRLIWYAAVGYFVSILSFTGYLFIANHIYQLQKDFQGGSATIKALKQQEKTLPVEGQAPQTEIVEQTSANDALKVQYQIARKYFFIYFYITAGVLSMVVLWVGSLFSALNSMDVMRYYKYVSGNNFLPNDFVYLFGGLHSLLLLIFFLPVQVNMFSLNTFIPEIADKTDTTNSWGDLVKRLGQNVGNLLVVSSPILASLLHGLLNK
jgi:hypothetical protein